MSDRSWACKKYKQKTGIKACELCGSKRCLEVHHIIPVVCGGDNSFDNLIVVCSACHAKLTPKKLLHKLGRLETYAKTGATTKLEEAEKMIIAFLLDSNGAEVTVGELETAVANSGVTYSTLRRAKAKLKQDGKIIVSSSGGRESKKWTIEINKGRRAS